MLPCLSGFGVPYLMARVQAPWDSASSCDLSVLLVMVVGTGSILWARLTVYDCLWLSTVRSLKAPQLDCLEWHIYKITKCIIGARLQGTEDSSIRADHSAKQGQNWNAMDYGLLWILVSTSQHHSVVLSALTGCGRNSSGAEAWKTFEILSSGMIR